MSKSDGVLGKACSGLAARSFHTHWQDVAPVPVGPSRSDMQREAFNYLKQSARDKDKFKGRKVWRNGEFVIL